MQNLEELDAKTAGDLNAVLAGLWRIGAADLARMIAEKGVEASYYMRRHLSGALKRKSPIAWTWSTGAHGGDAVQGRGAA